MYQGSTNASFNDSYCKSFKVYYSTEQVTKDNKGEIQWKLAGSCDNGTIYNGSGIKINTAEDAAEENDAPAVMPEELDPVVEEIDKVAVKAIEDQKGWKETN